MSKSTSNRTPKSTAKPAPKPAPVDLAAVLTSIDARLKRIEIDLCTETEADETALRKRALLSLTCEKSDRAVAITIIHAELSTMTLKALAVHPALVYSSVDDWITVARNLETMIQRTVRVAS